MSLRTVISNIYTATGLNNYNNFPMQTLLLCEYKYVALRFCVFVIFISEICKYNCKRKHGNLQMNETCILIKAVAEIKND